MLPLEPTNTTSIQDSVNDMPGIDRDSPKCPSRPTTLKIDPNRSSSPSTEPSPPTSASPVTPADIPVRLYGVRKSPQSLGYPDPAIVEASPANERPLKLDEAQGPPDLGHRAPVVAAARSRPASPVTLIGELLHMAINLSALSRRGAVVAWPPGSASTIPPNSKPLAILNDSLRHSDPVVEENYVPGRLGAIGDATWPPKSASGVVPTHALLAILNDPHLRRSNPVVEKGSYKSGSFGAIGDGRPVGAAAIAMNSVRRALERPASPDPDDARVARLGCGAKWLPGPGPRPLANKDILASYRGFRGALTADELLAALIGEHPCFYVPLPIKADRHAERGDVLWAIDKVLRRCGTSWKEVLVKATFVEVPPAFITEPSSSDPRITTVGEHFRTIQSGGSAWANIAEYLPFASSKENKKQISRDALNDEVQ